MSDNKNQALVALCTCPDSETAHSLAAGLVHKRLAACVNIVPSVRSVYLWNEEVQDDSEALMVIKTSADGFADMQAWLLENHPYAVPEVIALPVCAGSDTYLQWIFTSIDPHQGSETH